VVNADDRDDLVPPAVMTKAEVVVVASVGARDGDEMRLLTDEDSSEISRAEASSAEELVPVELE